MTGFVGTGIFLRESNGNVFLGGAWSVPWRNDFELTSFYNPPGCAGSPGMCFAIKGAFELRMVGSRPGDYVDAWLGPHYFKQ